MGWYSKLIEENCEELEFYGQKEKCLNPKISVIVPVLKVSLFGINVLKVEYYFPNITKYKLFGFLTVLTVKKVF